MQHLSINLRVHEKLYLKDPLSSELGKKIVQHGVALIESLGFAALLWANTLLQGSLFPVLLAAGVGITFPHILLIGQLFRKPTT